MKYMRFFIGDYHKDTQHLSQTENCAYFLLLMHYAATERPLPDNDKVLSRISKCSSLRAWLKIKDVIAEFFTIENGFWYQRKAEEEIELYTKSTQQKSHAVKKRWEKKEALTSSENETFEQKEIGDKSQKTLINQQNIDTAVLRPHITPTSTPSKNSIFNNTTISYNNNNNLNAAVDISEKDLTDRKFIREKVVQLSGNNPNMYVTIGMVDKWLDAGCDPLLDIFPSIQIGMARKQGNPPNSLAYFSQAVINSKALRLKPLPSPKENHYASSKSRPNRYLDAMARTNF